MLGTKGRFFLLLLSRALPVRDKKSISCLPSSISLDLRLLDLPQRWVDGRDLSPLYCLMRTGAALWWPCGNRPPSRVLPLRRRAGGYASR